ncbi:hypothetical protein [Entomospira culicis]|uniref:Lipoprotein n=1 Tax=Entomospira culicis TaxID=2719989 RepID=A0A968KUT2_9SPIO|nr:hypothetical protein [Entomospira culicis]NIZ19675.1 hypothetical protein [Entomospira culicis]NIZ69889.1 hypothetical protein [Entomospira culicis]WDI36994.1 hypothetical protein PVA46_06665 [Entomospira culicis]WDI38623.1 hypothetical protein PVA47_06675 [Entomospira culicis]
MDSMKGYRFFVAIMVLMILLGCRWERAQIYDTLEVLQISDPQKMAVIREQAELAFTKQNVSTEIKSELGVVGIAFFYLQDTYGWIYGSRTTLYHGGFLERKDLSAVLEDGIWHVYHKKKAVMQMRQSDGGIVSMAGFGENAKQQRLMNEGFVYDADLAVKRAYLDAGKGREQMSYEVFPYYSEAEQDVIWYVRLGVNQLAIPGYMAIRQKDAVILGHSYGKYCE